MKPTMIIQVLLSFITHRTNEDMAERV